MNEPYRTPVRASPGDALLDAQARNGAGDHQLLDLGCAFENSVDLGVAMNAFDVVLARVAVAAQDLNGFAVLDAASKAMA